MLRVLVTSFVAATLACSGVAITAAASESHPGTLPDSGAGDCAKVTFVTSDADELTYDIYVAKNEPAPRDPTTPDELKRYAIDAVREALRHVTDGGQAPAQAGDVQVEVVWPKNHEAGTDGYRVGFLVDLSGCGA